MSNLVYKITRPLARQALKVYFKGIHFSNVENVPLDKPVILVCNHPTAFIEPIILACYLPKPMSYLVRGDVFSNLFVRKILEAYNMIPIYRFVDGYSNLKKNTSSLEYCYQALNEKKMIMIMVEGLTHRDKKLLPLQKGAARIVFDTIEKYGTALDIQIVPVGINYTDDTVFRSEVMVDFGKPISVNDYWDLYQEHDKKAIRKLTQDLFPLMQKHIIEIEDVQNTELIEQAFVLYRNSKWTNPFYRLNNSNLRLLDEKRISERINRMDSLERDALKQKMSAYFIGLEDFGIQDIGVAQPQNFSLKNAFMLVILIVPAIVGYILNASPFIIGNMITKKYIHDIEFFAPTRLLLVFIQYIFVIFGLLGLFVVGGNIFIGFLIVLIPISGLGYICFIETYKKWISARKLNKLPSNFSQSLITKRKELSALTTEL